MVEVLLPEGDRFLQFEELLSFFCLHKFCFVAAKIAQRNSALELILLLLGFCDLSTLLPKPEGHMLGH